MTNMRYNDESSESWVWGNTEPQFINVLIHILIIKHIIIRVRGDLKNNPFMI